MKKNQITIAVAALAVLFITGLALTVRSPKPSVQQNTKVEQAVKEEAPKQEPSPQKTKTSTDAVQMMAPHKALYDIKMVSKHSGTQILNISGQMFYEWKPTCEGWVSNHHFTLYYEYADSPSMKITSDFSTYETYDGQSFNYTSRRKRNGELYQELRGQAEINSKGLGKASFTKPEGLHFDLKEGTLFPTRHTLDVLKSALNGEHFFNATIFDGSDEDGPVEINTFIGEKVDPSLLPKANDSIDAAILNTPAWKIRMAFFPLAEQSADSDYEMDVIFHENGVISDMLVEYKDFSVSQKLTALESLEETGCEESAEK